MFSGILKGFEINSRIFSGILKGFEINSCVFSYILKGFKISSCVFSGRFIASVEMIAVFSKVFLKPLLT